MTEFFFLPVVIAVWVWTIFDVWRTDGLDVLRLPKAGWMFGAITLPLIGTVGWIMLGRPNRRPRWRRKERPNPRPVGPEDEPNWVVDTTPSKPIRNRAS